MLIEQIHFPQNGPNWGKIALVSLSLIAAGVIIYQITKSIKPKIEPQKTE
ncbi:MAG: hypothetical protein Q7W45_10745 [Bacteroidota bacterium]|nr:hypothetical protein [Bacteroidota bacterium]MDP3146067.1 hypothetical protein [Bacteroidota bacterium]